MDSMEKLTPMMRQYHDVKKRHPGTLVFFRMGDFYEMFYEDAVIISRELDITLTSRNNDKKGNPIPMAGIPHHALDNYLNRLVRKGFKVVICEQVEDPRQAKGIVKRDVTRIVTPGTAVEDDLLESRENNFLAALHQVDDGFGLGFVDASTGEFWVTEFVEEPALEKAQEELLHFRPRELIYPERLEDNLIGLLPSDFVGSLVRSPQPDWHFNVDYAQRLLFEHFKVSTLDGFGARNESLAIGVAGALLEYLRHTHKSSLAHITSLRFAESSRHLKLDETTVANLELIRATDGSRRWTLLSTIDFTRTGMGARLLRNWILRPSRDLAEIDFRLDAVGELRDSVTSQTRIGEVLKKVQDVERLLSRVTLETANPRDLLALRGSLEVLPALSALVEHHSAAMLAPLSDHLEDVVEILRDAIDDGAPVSINDGGILRAGYNSELDELREMASSGKSFIARMENEERQRTGIGNLKVRYNRVFGYFIEVTKSHLESVPDHYTRKQTLVNAERFITPELKEYEEKILGAEERILRLERELFVEIRRNIAVHARRIQDAARKVASIDVLVALAEVAFKYGYSRPTLDDSRVIDIRSGRHPVLERHDSEPFVPNDLLCDTDQQQVLILTGPNMGGKSTYLRQNALIVILAQMGSFVPAEKARVGLVDRIYTRVGASDHLARGRSTFMVEMIETAHILNTASPASLILLDEVGRGTATFDGLSIAWSVAEFLVTEPSRKARTIFATHYQEITKLEKLYPGVKNYCVAVREANDEIIFFHRVMEGVASKSYGIEVARLAGLPPRVLERAREILKRLERRQLDLAGRRGVTEDVIEELQPNLFR